MSDLVERLRFGGNHKSEATRHEAADRIEALEEHKRLQTEDVMNLGATLGQAWLRIKQLEAALREIADLNEVETDEPLDDAIRIACAALDQSSPPARQENDDVYLGFRGNNEA